MINIELRLFGAFRVYGGDKASLQFTVPDKTSIAGVKALLVETISKEHPGFSDRLLVGDSAIADEQRVLSDDAVLERSCQLAILPPVCGG